MKTRCGVNSRVEDVIARTHNAGVKEVVVKRGADSCLVSIAGEGLVDVPAVKLPKEKVIDTTAAGDSFSAVIWRYV